MSFRQNSVMCHCLYRRRMAAIVLGECGRRLTGALRFNVLGHGR